MVDSIRDKTAVVGAGMTEIGTRPRTALSGALEAFKLALEDSGPEKKDIDGVMMLSRGVDYYRFLETIGLDVKFAFQGWTHGRFAMPLVMQAVLVLNAGLADTIAIVGGHPYRPKRIGPQDQDPEMWRQGLGPHGESPAYGAVSRAYGAVSRAYGAAVSAQRYFHLYGGDNSRLAPIATTLRGAASAILEPSPPVRT